ncbi:MAG: tetratricopeptide repeat protein [Planctomycetia bacterium]|nr:MAG: tetratricopeptide repeat protein [Planctomycetia bacterium]
MNPCWLSIAMVCCACGAAAETLRAAPVQFVRTRDVLLEVRVDAADAVRAWVSEDYTTTWQPVELSRSGELTYCFRAERDGAYAFYFAPVASGAASSHLTYRDDAAAEPGQVDAGGGGEGGRYGDLESDEPCSGAPPHALVIVDSQAPLVQFRDLVVSGDAEDATAYGRVVLIDEDQVRTRLFYRTAMDPTWRDAGELQLAAGRFAHPLPRLLEAQIDLSVSATDRAGNVSHDQRLGVSAPPPGENPTELAGGGPPRSMEPVSAAVPVGAAGVDIPPGDAELHSGIDPAQRGPDAGTTQRRAEALRAMAAQFAAEGRHPLAIARLREALTLAPDDPDVLRELARSEFAAARYDEAFGHFEAALRMRPEDAESLDGLALVAATQRRYPDARRALERLLRLQPEVARTWLNFGDVEYRMGQAAEARRAWEKAEALSGSDAEVRAGSQRRLRLLSDAPLPLR